MIYRTKGTGQRITPTEINLKHTVLHVVCVLSQAVCDHKNLPWEILQRTETISAVTQIVIPAQAEKRGILSNFALVRLKRQQEAQWGTQG